MLFLILGSNVLIALFILSLEGTIYAFLLNFFSYFKSAFFQLILMSFKIFGTIEVSTAFPDLLLSKKDTNSLL